MATATPRGRGGDGGVARGALGASPKGPTREPLPHPNVRERPFHAPRRRRARGRVGPDETDPRLTSRYMRLARRTLVTRLLVPSALKTSSVVDSVHRRCTRLHRVMASGAGGAGLFRGGTTLWLMSFLLSFATALSPGALVPKITKPRESASPKPVIFVLNDIRKTSQIAAKRKSDFGAFHFHALW